MNYFEEEKTPKESQRKTPKLSPSIRKRIKISNLLKKKRLRYKVTCNLIYYYYFIFLIKSHRPQKKV